MASGDAVQQIKDRLSIVDVVAPYVELHKAGKSFKGKSPFTPEKTPSFFVSPDRGMYYCFSTSQGGDMFSFVQTMEGLDFKGALKILAEKAGVELVAEDPKQRSEREAGYAALEAATLFYQSSLKGKAEAMSYLKDRGVSDDTIRDWRIGYAPGPPEAGWRECGSYLEAAKHSEATLLRSGILKASGQGKAPYDVFRDRIMFPIFDPSGRVIAFSGRILNKDSEAPKYVNSPETPLFNKSEALYGYDKAKVGIRKLEFSLIVEGQFDVVLAHQAGYGNTVAVSGTAMTNHHAGLLQRLSDRVVLALDADRAGIAAVKRAADLMLVRGMDVKVAQIPDGQDPADIIQADPAEFKRLIGQSTHVIEFLLKVLKSQAKDERSFKLTGQEEIIPYLLRLQSHIERDHFEAVVAEALGTTKEAVHLEAERQSAQQKEVRRPEAPASMKPLREAVAAPEAAPTRQSDVAAFLAVLELVLEPDEWPVIERALQSHGFTDAAAIREKLAPERVSALTFTLEERLGALSKKERQQELNHKVYEWRLQHIRSALGVEKEALYAKERAGEDTSEAIGKVNDLQKQLATASEPIDLFTPETV